MHDELTEEMLAQIIEDENETAGSHAVVEEPAEPIKKALRPLPEGSSLPEATVAVLLMKYPILPTRSSHWTLDLIGIITKINYRPSLKVVGDQAKYLAAGGFDQVGAMGIVLKHLTEPMLEEIVAEVENYVQTHDLKLTMTDRAGKPVEGEIIVGENGGLAYRADVTEVDEKSNSSADPDWASW